jgi:hypothetical protein
MTSEIRVAYVAGTFPSLTQTFVASELYWASRSGIDPQVFSLFRPDGPVQP